MRIIVDGGGLAIERRVKLDVRNKWLGSDTIRDEKDKMDDPGVWIDGCI